MCISFRVRFFVSVPFLSRSSYPISFPLSFRLRLTILLCLLYLICAARRMKAQNYAMIINAQQNLKTAQQAEAAAAEAAAGQESVNDFKFVINDYPQQVRETVLLPPSILRIA